MAQEHEQKINEILISQPDNVRLFKSRAGVAWQGKVTRKGRFIIMEDAIPFHGMPDGFPDICGLTSIEITSDMVGKKIAVFTAIEVKTGKQKLKKLQQSFRDLIIKMGGIYKIV